MARYNLFFTQTDDMSTSSPDGFGVPWGVPGDGSHLMGHTLSISPAAASLGIPIEDNNLGLQDDEAANQTLAEARTYNGTDYAQGTGLEAEYELTVTDGVDTHRIIALSIDGVSGWVIGFVFENPPPPSGVALTVTGHSDFPWITYSEATPACFTPGALILTPGGERPVETLRAGDLVQTLDRGPQPVDWAGRRPLDLTRAPEHRRPVRIRAGALGPGRPLRDLTLSPQHRVLTRDGGDEALAPARAFALAATPGVESVAAGRTAYFHLLLPRHEILFAEGLPVESFRPGPQALAGLPPDQRAALIALRPGLAADPEAALGPPARPLLSMGQARRRLTRPCAEAV